MDRRDFLRNTLAITALAPLSRFASAAEVEDGKKGGDGKVPQVTRRRYKNSDITLPLLGFGMMRLPQIDSETREVDVAMTEKMVARAMEAGVNYFDTAYVYHGGKSETVAGNVLKKYPRDSYYLADKMPVYMLRQESDAERYFKEQLERCQTEYFDFYLFHCLNADFWKTCKQFHVYDFLKKMQKEGKIRKLGFSFHDEPEVLKEIAEAHPWDFAMIQLNYLDWELYRSREQYEILTKLGIPVLVMEPLRGGALASLNEEATGIFQKANPKVSTASWAFRYAASLPNVHCVLSGMSLPEHLEDNIKTMTQFKPLTGPEQKTIQKALVAFKKSATVPCTTCRYCAPCPVGVDIPRIFGLYNQYKASGNFFAFQMIYGKMKEEAKASACVACGECMKKCPQKIDIPAELKKIDEEVKKRSRPRAMGEDLENRVLA